MTVIKPLFPQTGQKTEQPATSDFVQQQLKENPHVVSIATNSSIAHQIQNPVIRQPGQEVVIVGSGTGVGKSTFAPVSPKQLVDAGVSSPRVMQLLATFDSPTGIMEYGKDIMSEISSKSSKMFDDVKDADAEFVDTQLRGILTLAKSLHLSGKKESNNKITSFFSGLKEKFIDVKEQMMSEFNDISTQMDRTLSEVEQANARMMGKVKSLQDQYQSNLTDYRNLDQIIKEATEAFQVKSKDFEKRKTAVKDAIDAQELQRFQSNLDRLDKKIDSLKKFQLMVLQDAPDLAQKEDNAITLMEKFDTIKTMTIPLWKKQIRAYIDGLDINRAAKLANAVDDANNAMIVANSNMSRQTNLDVATLNQRAIIDDTTAEKVHENLINTLADVLEINEAGRTRRIESSTRIDEMKRMYSNIQSGQLSAKDAAKEVNSK